MAKCGIRGSREGPKTEPKGPSWRQVGVKLEASWGQVGAKLGSKSASKLHDFLTSFLIGF